MKTHGSRVQAVRKQIQGHGIVFLASVIHYSLRSTTTGLHPVSK